MIDTTCSVGQTSVTSYIHTKLHGGTVPASDMAKGSCMHLSDKMYKYQHVYVHSDLSNTNYVK